MIIALRIENISSWNIATQVCAKLKKTTCMTMSRTFLCVYVYVKCYVRTYSIRMAKTGPRSIINFWCLKKSSTHIFASL